MRVSSVAALLLLVPIAACGCDDDGSHPAKPGSDLPQLEVDTGYTGTEEVVHQLLNTRIPTQELVSRLPGGDDPKTVSLIALLRITIRRQDNDGWPHKEGFRGGTRCCSVDALRWSRGVSVEVHVLRLPPSLVAQYVREGGSEDYVPLKVAKEVCLRSAVERGELHDSYGPIVLRGGETARLTSGWTRARLSAFVADGHAQREFCRDSFSGLRVSITAHVSGGEMGTWELGMFMSSGGLEGDTGVEARGDVWLVQQARNDHVLLGGDKSRLTLAREERCWLGRLRSGHPRSAKQVLVCARVIEVD